MRLDAILTCVNYDDYLQITLPENIVHFDNFVIVTDKEDLATQHLAEKYGATCVIRKDTKVFDANGTKGKAINDGLQVISPTDWVVHLDADIILPEDFRTALTQLNLDKNTLYWTLRKQPATRQQFSEYLQDKITIHDWEGVNPEGSPARWVGPFGYFQMFNVSSEALQNYSTIYPEFATSEAWTNKANEGAIDWKASQETLKKCTDGVFNNRWPKSRKVKLPNNFCVLHIPHGPCRINWSGRKSKRFSWPNCGPGFFLDTNPSD